MRSLVTPQTRIGIHEAVHELKVKKLISYEEANILLFPNEYSTL